MKKEIQRGKRCKCGYDLSECWYPACGAKKEKENDETKLQARQIISEKLCNMPVE